MWRPRYTPSLALWFATFAGPLSAQGVPAPAFPTPPIAAQALPAQGLSTPAAPVPGPVGYPGSIAYPGHFTSACGPVPGCASCPTPAASAADYTLAPTDEKEEASKEPWRLCPDPFCGFKFTGWLYGTSVLNASNAGSTRYNGPLTTNDQEGYYLNQFWFNLSRPLSDDEFSWGATFDVFFGNDYLASQSRGFELSRNKGWQPKWWDNQDYGLTIPQAYAEFGTTKYNVRVGHFYTPHGYMTVQAVNNFFNTLPFGFMWTNPFTHWGMMSNAALTDNLSVMFGLVNGWDALDRQRNSVSYMAGAKYTFAEKKGYVSTNVITGLEPENLGSGYASRTLVTNIFNYNLTDNFEFVFENNLGWQGNHGLETSMFYNYVPYLFYKLNDAWKLGFRYEYFHDPSGFAAAERWGNPNFGPNPLNNLGGPYHGNFQSLVWGLNWRPGGSLNVNIRPEIRYDWFNGSGQPFDAGTKDHQIMLMCGSYITY